MTDQVHKTHGQFMPTQLVIFGATGDLAMRYLLPTLIHMDRKNLLPKTFSLLCVSRRDLDTDSFFDLILQNNPKLKIKDSEKNHFKKRLEYYRGNFDDPQSFQSLLPVLQKGVNGEPDHHVCYNRLYYFATEPKFFKTVASILQKNNLLEGCSEHSRTIRVLVEKPFGTDYKTAKALNKELLKYFKEPQIYRIDHYLGKETVQNLFVARFANDFLEPIWNKKFIDHVEISALESVGIENRSEYYDNTGAIKDMVQNHLLQMLALIASDKPKSLSTEDIRDQKVKILKRLRPLKSKQSGDNVLIAQYKGYADEIGQTSSTETYAVIKAFIDLPRWADVPFYLRTGKKLNKKVTEISIHFKKLKNNLFANRAGNVLTFRIQPDESVSMRINNKIPGFGIDTKSSDLQFGYKAAFQEELPTAYERLLLDFIQGDQRLFIRSDEIEAAWKFIDSVQKHLPKLPLHKYEAGSVGPVESETFIASEGRSWWTV